MARTITPSSHSTCAIALATATELEFGGLAPGGEQHASRLAAHRAVKALAPSARRIAIDHAPGRAPTVFTGEDATPIALSLTHCDGRGAAFAAVAPARIGIDLEREDAAGAKHARYFLTSREAAALRCHSVVALWALKEAAWKALALQSDVAFHAVELQIS
jgi:4'-phosphopantetheinyl transferase EntD